MEKNKLRQLENMRAAANRYHNKADRVNLFGKTFLRGGVIAILVNLFIDSKAFTVTAGLIFLIGMGVSYYAIHLYDKAVGIRSDIIEYCIEENLNENHMG